MDGAIISRARSFPSGGTERVLAPGDGLDLPLNLPLDKPLDMPGRSASVVGLDLPLEPPPAVVWPERPLAVPAVQRTSPRLRLLLARLPSSQHLRTT